MIFGEFFGGFYQLPLFKDVKENETYFKNNEKNEKNEIKIDRIDNNIDNNNNIYDIYNEYIERCVIFTKTSFLSIRY